jgi:stage II sporulation protein M
MSWLKEQNRLTHEFCRGELSHFLHITACAFAALAVIGLVLGLLAAFYLQNDISLWYYLAGILPHGIFELPALVIALALGVSLCSHVTDFVRHNQKGVMVPLMLQTLRVLLLRVLPLLIVAAVMEAYVTPLVLALLG